MKTIVFIGPVNKGSIPSGGQVAKNQAFLEYFEKKHKVFVIDTFGWGGKPFIWVKFLLGMFIASDLIVISLSSESAYRVIRTLRYFGKDKKTVYIVVGGWFDKMLGKNPSRLKYYSGLKAVQVQGQAMVSAIKSLGINQVDYFPNFRKFEKHGNTSGGGKKNQRSKKFLYLSRIDHDKGASIVLDALEAISLENAKFDFEIDFYGHIESDFENEFLAKIDKLKFAHYKGVIDLRKADNYRLLGAEQYTSFLFCTTFIGEGFPGAVLDAMILGIPVIASDWNYNSEVIRNNIDGIIIPPNDKLALTEAIKKISSDAELQKKYSNSVLDRSLNYHVDRVLGDFEKKFLC